MDAKGRTETIYLGSRKSPKQWRVYDKRREIAANGGHPPAHELTRVERVIRTGVPLKNLAGLKNPFLDIAACDLSAACPLVPPHVWRMFQDSCRYRGLNSALAPLPKAERQKYRQALSAAKHPWWKPELFWEQWQPAIDAVGLLTPSLPSWPHLPHKTLDETFQ